MKYIKHANFDIHPVSTNCTHQMQIKHVDSQQCSILQQRMQQACLQKTMLSSAHQSDIGILLDSLDSQNVKRNATFHWPLPRMTNWPVEAEERHIILSDGFHRYLTIGDVVIVCSSTFTSAVSKIWLRRLTSLRQNETVLSNSYIKSISFISTQYWTIHYQAGHISLSHNFAALAQLLWQHFEAPIQSPDPRSI